MKWHIYITGCFLLMLVASCTRDFEKINTNPNESAVPVPGQLLAPALVNAVSFNMNRNRGFNNELMQVSVNIGDGEGKVFRYDFRANWSDYLYNGLYDELTNFKDILRIASQELNYNQSYMAISLICQSWVYSILTDTYGDIPYSESNRAKPDSNGVSIKQPAFDRQKDIYLDIFKQLDSANNLFKENIPIDGQADPVYNGNIEKWRKFGNSLYLRLLLRISAKPEVAEQCIAKIKEIAETDKENYPIIENNDESAILRWVGTGPYVSPYAVVRPQDFRAVRIGKFFLDNLNAWNDPRMNIPTYGRGGINRWGIAPVSGQYVGVPSGYAPGEALPDASYFYATDQTVSGSRPPVITMQTEPLTGMILNYAEVQFMLAEMAVRGWISEPAETYYNAGAESSIKLWLPQWDEDIAGYLSAADINWDDALSFDQKMERIHQQKYYAMLFEDLQQWFEYRRTGHPALPKGAGLRNNGVMPARMNYPVYVQSANPGNYQKAVQEQGPDVISTEVWWQKK